MDWNGDNYIKQVERTVAQNVQAAGYHLVGKVRELISTPSRTVTAGTTRGGKAKKTLGARGSSRSKPGEAPRKDYGRLRQSIAQQHMSEQLRSLVGTNLAYGKHLELGTRNMAPRPYLRRTLAEQRAAIVSIVATGKP